MRRLLSSAGAYWLVQRLLGAAGVHRHLVTEHARVQPGERVLDIGCGTGRLLDALPEVTYVGVDPDPAYIVSASRRYGERARFHQGSVASVDLDAEDRFDVAFAVGVLHHLDDAEARVLADVAARSLAPGGRLVTLDPALIEGQPALARWLAARDRGARVRAPGGYRDLMETAFTSVGETVRHDLAVLPYTHVVLECIEPRG